MSNDIIPFQFETNEIRTVVDGDVVWFVGRDVAGALGYKDAADALKTHCKTCKSLKDIASGKTPEGLPGNAILIQERDIYRLVMRSKMPAAEKFEEWVVGEVLPSIRKTGSYAVVLSPAEQLVVQAQMLVDHERRVKKAEAEAAQAKKLSEESSKRLDQIESAIDHFTVIGYARYVLKMSLSREDASLLGKMASEMCRSQGFPMGSVPDPRYGRVNTYPKSVLDQLIQELSTEEETTIH